MSEHIMWRLKEQTPYTNVLDGELMKEAAAEITRLREENAQLVDILDDVLAQWDGDWPEELYARVKAAIREGGKDGRTG